MQVWDDAITNAVRKDFLAGTYMGNAAQTVLEALAPGALTGGPIEFAVSDSADGLVVTTDVDFHLLNQVFHQRVPPEIATVTPAFVLSELLEGEVQLQRGAEYDAEIVTDSITSQVLQIKCADLVRRSQGSQDKIDTFQERLLKGRDIRSAINNGSRSLGDLVDILESARRFRNRIDDKPDDTDLLASYYDEVTRRSWIERLPAKTIRWAVFGGAGIALSAAGLPVVEASAATLGLGAIDDLVLDRIAKGWRPSHFVESSLKPFVQDG